MKIVFTILCISFLIPLSGYSQTERRPKYAPRKEKHKNRTDELDRKQGLWQHYNYLGTLIWEVDYTDDKRNGISRRYYYNGRVMKETEYVYGIRDGFFKRYDYDGMIRTEGEYADGKKAKHWSNYYSSGQLRNEGDYSNGHKNGLWKYYNRKGDLINTITFVNGQDSKEILAAEKRAEEVKKAAEAKARAKTLLEKKPAPILSQHDALKKTLPESK